MAVVLGHREASASRRSERRRRAAARALTTVSPNTFADPLDPSRRSASPLRGWLFASASLHAALVVWALAPRRIDLPDRDSYRQPVRISFTQPQAEPAQPIVEAPLAPRPRPVIAHKTVAVEPPPDPIDLAPEPAPPKPSPRRIVGLSMESTVDGPGPGYAVGNTRMGQTARVADRPEAAEPLAAQVTPPRRAVTEKPVYPPSLRAQQIEGDVGLEVHVDASGRVVAVTVAESSAHEEFDRAAVLAACHESYEPARANGVAIAHTLRFTVRFRLRQ